MNARLNLYHYVICFMGECCDRPHLWGQSVMSTSEKSARAKAISVVKKAAGVQQVFELIEVPGGFKEVLSATEKE